MLKRIIRPLLVIFVAFACTALYIQASFIYHSGNRWDAMITVAKEAWYVTVGAVVILVLYIYAEIHDKKKGDAKENRLFSLLEAIAKKLGVDVEEIKNKPPKTK